MKTTHPSIRVTVGHQPPQAAAPGAFAEASPELHQAFTPPIDIHEGPDGLTLEADLPGATEANLFIQLEDNVLSLHARIEPPAPEGARTASRRVSRRRLLPVVHPQRRGRSRADHGGAPKRGSSPRPAQGRSGSSQAYRDPVVNRPELTGGTVALMNLIHRAAGSLRTRATAEITISLRSRLTNFWSQSMGRSNQWRRESFIPFNFLQNELARVLEDYFQPEGRGGRQSPPTDLEPSGWSPLIDVYETPEDTIVVAEIPGVDPTKIELSISGNLLILRGVKEIGELPEAQLQVRERRFGTFLRQVMVPADVDFDAAQADAKNGVLTVRMPRRRAAQPRTIPIRPS